MEDDLITAFEDAMIEFGEIEGIPVNTPNSHDFAKPTSQDGKYLDVIPLKTTPQVLAICNGVSRHQWVLQASIYVRSGDGDRRTGKIADKIRERFPVASKLTGSNHSFTVMTQPSPSNAIPEPGWYQTPVSFRVSTIH